MIATDEDLIKNMRMSTSTRQLLTILDGLSVLIQDPQHEFKAKVTAAMVAWERITSLASSSGILIDTTKLFSIISGTMRLVLHDDWETMPGVMKTKLGIELKNFLEIVKNNKYQVANLQTLINMIDDPWGHPAWKSILQNIDLPESVKEELVVGTSLELVLRLEVLLTSGHEDAALEVASLAMHSFVQSYSNLGNRCCSQHKIKIIDWYTQLLYKKQQHDVFEKGLPLPIQDPQLEYLAKVSAALFAWERQKYLPAFNDMNKMQSIISGTMRLVLHDYWKTVPGVLKNKLNQQLKHFSKIVENNKNQAVLLLALMKMIKDPWGHPTWQSILNNVNLSDSVNKEELVVGTTSLELVLRLEVLLMSGLEDAALEVASLAMHSFVQANSNLGKQSSSQHKIQIIDWYTQLLYKKQQQKYIFEKVLKCITFDEGVQLVKRISSKSKDALLKDCSASDIALLCASSLLTHSISKSSLHIKTLAELASVWAYLHQKKGTGVGTVTKKVEELLKQAQSSQHVYALCSILQEHKKVCKEVCGKFVEEVVSCLGGDINKREKQKGQSATVTSADIALSYGFSQLAKLFSDDNIMYRECLLSSFSLNPTKEMYSQLVKVAGEKYLKKADNKQSSEKNQKHKTVKDSNRRNSKLQVSVSNMSVKSCIDLSNIINKVRVGRLSWSMPWHELSVLCQRYFLHPEARPLTSTRNKRSPSKISTPKPTIATAAKTDKNSSISKIKVTSNSINDTSSSKSQPTKKINEDLQVLVESVCKKLIISDDIERKNMSVLELPSNLALPFNKNKTNGSTEQSVKELETKISTFLNTKKVTDPTTRTGEKKLGSETVGVAGTSNEIPQNADLLSSVNLSISLLPDYAIPLVMQTRSKALNKIDN